MKKFLHYSLLVLSCGALMLAACNKQVPVTPSSTEESSEPAPDPGPGPAPEPASKYELPKSFDEAQFFVFDNAMPVQSEDEMEISMLLIESGLYSITGVNLVSYSPEYRELLNEFEVYECVEEQYQLYSNDVFTCTQEISYKQFISGYVSDSPASSFESIGYIDARETQTYDVSYNYHEGRSDALEFWSLGEIPEYYIDNHMEAAYASGATEAIGEAIFGGSFLPFFIAEVEDSYLFIYVSTHGDVRDAHVYEDSAYGTFNYLQTSRKQGIFQMSKTGAPMSYYWLEEVYVDHDLKTGALLNEPVRDSFKMMSQEYSVEAVKPFEHEAEFRASVPMYATSIASVSMDVTDVEAYNEETGDITLSTDPATHMTKDSDNARYYSEDYMKFTFSQADLAKGTGYKAIQFSSSATSICLKGEHIGETINWAPVGLADENVNAFPESSIVESGGQHYVLVPLAELDNYYELEVVFPSATEDGKPAVFMAHYVNNPY